MGNCVNKGSKLEIHNPDAQANKTIERQIKADEKKLRTEVKILLLGIYKRVYIFSFLTFNKKR